MIYGFTSREIVKVSQQNLILKCQFVFSQSSSGIGVVTRLLGGANRFKIDVIILFKVSLLELVHWN